MENKWDCDDGHGVVEWLFFLSLLLHQPSGKSGSWNGIYVDFYFQIVCMCVRRRLGLCFIWLWERASNYGKLLLTLFFWAK